MKKKRKKRYYNKFNKKKQEITDFSSNSKLIHNPKFFLYWNELSYFIILI